MLRYQGVTGGERGRCALRGPSIPERDREGYRFRPFRPGSRGKAGCRGQDPLGTFHSKTDGGGVRVFPGGDLSRPVNRSRSIRVLLANHHVWEPGGAENYAIFLAAGLDRLGYRVVLTWNEERPPPEWPDGEVPRTVEIIRHRYSGVRDIRARLPMSLWDPRIRGEMRKLCGQIAADVIHVNQIYEGDGIDLVQGALEHGKGRVFGTIHLRVDPPEANRLLGAGKRFLLRSFFRRHRYVKICPSASQRAGFARVYGDDGLLRVVPNGIPLHPLLNDRGVQEARLVLGAEGKTVLAYAGRICR
ncbi:MAG: hypothetical protein E4H29_04760, partial [Deltaproteobacteria bacterium]